jgi:hypothetical protein
MIKVLRRVGYLFMVAAILDFIAGIFYFLIAVPASDYFRMAIGLTHFASALVFYLIGVYLTVYCTDKCTNKEIE